LFLSENTVQRDFAPASKMPTERLQEAEDMGVILPLMGRDSKFVDGAFLVLKSDGVSSRFIWNGKRLSLAQYVPWDHGIPCMKSLAMWMAKHSWMMNADGMSWFYQFEVSPEVGAWFSLRQGARKWRMARLPQGWAASVAIAQTASLILLEGLNGSPWIDNFSLVSHDKCTLLREWSIFSDRCKYVGAVLKGPEPEPAQTGVHFNLYFDLIDHRYKVDPTWVLRISLAHSMLTQKQHISWRACQSLTGCLVWYSWISDLILGLTLYRSMRFLARHTRADPPPGQMIEIPDKVRQEWTGLLKTMQTGSWVQYSPPTGKVHILTDASWKGLCAIVWQDGQPYARQLTTNKHEMLPGPINMPHLELQALDWGLGEATRLGLIEPGNLVVWSTDCLPAGLGMYKGHSPASECNAKVVAAMLKLRDLGCKLEGWWTEGKLNPADDGSRFACVSDEMMPVPTFVKYPIHIKLKSIFDEKDEWDTEDTDS
jgi:hypothetical protein